MSTVKGSDLDLLCLQLNALKNKPHFQKWWDSVTAWNKNLNEAEINECKNIFKIYD